MQRNELMQLLQSLGIEKLKVTGAGTNITGCCPFHQETRPSFGVSTEKLLYNCYSCHAKGSVEMLVARLRRIELGAARQILDRFGLRTDKESVLNLFRRPENGVTAHPVMSANYAPYITLERRKKAQTYLEKRGVVYRKFGTLSTNHNIGFDPKQNRAMFPWHDVDGRFYGCTGRTLDRGTGLYKYMPYFGLSKGRHLFMGHRDHMTMECNYVVVEGELDALKISLLADLTGFVAVALGNSRATDEQIGKLRQLGGCLAIGLDQDDAGQAGAKHLARVLRSLRPRLIHWPRKDAGACNNKQIVKTLEYQCFGALSRCEFLLLQ